MFAGEDSIRTTIFRTDPLSHGVTIAPTIQSFKTIVVVGGPFIPRAPGLVEFRQCCGVSAD
jgi:hypothetical protein